MTSAQAAATALVAPAPLTRRLARARARPADSAPRWHFRVHGSFSVGGSADLTPLIRGYVFRLGEHGQQAGRDERRIRGGADQIQLAADLESRRGRVRLPQLASEDVTADSLRQWCLARPSAVEEFPFGPEASVFKVGGKMFALTALDARPLTVSLKCEPSLAEALRAEHSAVRPGYHLNKRHWITVTLDNSLPDELVFGLLEDSYELVVDGLPKRERDRVRLSANR